MCPPVPFPLPLVVGAVASLVSVSATVPQVVRAFRSRSAEGVSWASLLLSLATFTLWCVYAAAVADEVQLVNDALGFGLLVALAVVVMRAGGAGWWSGGAAASLVVVAAAGVSLTVVSLLGPLVLAMLGTVSSSLRMWPQTRLALAGAPLWGLDPWATVLTWLGMLSWLSYGVLVADHALALASLAGLLMQSTITAFRLPPRRTLHSVAGGRLGPRAARIVLPAASRFPVRTGDYDLAA